MRRIILNDGKPRSGLNLVQKKAKNDVENKIKEGIYKYETYNCECGAAPENFELIAAKDRYGLNVETKICKKCGLVMTNPRMTQESYNQFYDLEYRPLYGGGLKQMIISLKNNIIMGK